MLLSKLSYRMHPSVFAEMRTKHVDIHRQELSSMYFRSRRILE
jgi:hypothetical protein